MDSSSTDKLINDAVAGLRTSKHLFMASKRPDLLAAEKTSFKPLPKLFVESSQEVSNMVEYFIQNIGIRTVHRAKPQQHTPKWSLLLMDSRITM